jgi:hypothetical protein
MTFLATNGVQSYANAVRDAMRDLPPDQAHAVLDGLDEHLAEIVAEGTVDLEAVLGSPESYAAELRASAGLPAAPRRTSWAAPPADLRSDAPMFDDADVEAERSVASGRTGVLARLLGRAFPTRLATLSKAFLVLFFGVLLVSLIRASRPLNIFHVVFGTLLIAGAWRLLRAASNRADLPATWAAYVPKVLGCTAVVLALILGSRMGSSGNRMIYVDIPAPSSVFATIPPERAGGEMSVPDMVGASLADTRVTLSRLNLNAVVVGGETGAEEQMLTTRMDPAPGMSVERGSVVRIFVAPMSSRIPTSSVAKGVAGASTVPPTATTVLPEATTAPSTATTSAAPILTTSTPTSAPATTVAK